MLLFLTMFLLFCLSLEREMLRCIWPSLGPFVKTSSVSLYSKASPCSLSDKALSGFQTFPKPPLRLLTS
uniref:Secreted protein n=1 Tax=Picea glauca TaxID=3330 RepID=A0A117NGC4_PICGL|nr:hypothetical protein ABT39_MTgene1700 [Picea glauca]QHR88034.1 hypothetical protein Q903MT_gene2046 [Picea sitchensis]